MARDGLGAFTRGLRELRKLKREYEQEGRPVPASILHEIDDCLRVLREGFPAIQEIQREVERR